ncbi:hypothetical protein KIW84_031069 [Lathyrus oleraceus]|uniref:Uncharacterized protein n=1 Tax=Pisum sativum TaxID=3888 RepID=A0A9D5AX08_PEA|nr:hypothetical protein KIW84_031069 [Pisum sativum]
MLTTIQGTVNCRETRPKSQKQTHFKRARQIYNDTQNVETKAASLSSHVALSENISSLGRGVGVVNLNRNAAAVYLMSGLGPYTPLPPEQCIPVMLLV